MAAQQHHPARGQTAKHGAKKNSKHHKAATGKKHHPAKGPTHLSLQQAIAQALVHNPQAVIKALPSLQHLASTLHQPKRGASLTLEALPLCAPVALAESLRIAGKPVDDDDVLALYHMAGSPEEGMSVLEAFVAAQWFGLAGAYPTFRPTRTFADGVVVGLTISAGPHTVTCYDGGIRTWGAWRPISDKFDDRVEEAWEVSWH